MHGSRAVPHDALCRRQYRGPCNTNQPQSREQSHNAPKQDVLPEVPVVGDAADTRVDGSTGQQQLEQRLEEHGDAVQTQTRETLLQVHLATHTLSQSKSPVTNKYIQGSNNTSMYTSSVIH